MFAPNSQKTKYFLGDGLKFIAEEHFNYNTKSILIFSQTSNRNKTRHFCDHTDHKHRYDIKHVKKIEKIHFVQKVNILIFLEKKENWECLRLWNSTRQI